MSNDRRERGLYWNRAWKLVEGCTKISPGCVNCWSEEETRKRERHPHPDIALRARTVLGGMENGFCGRILTRSDNFELPLRTKKPTVFAIWNDLFHEDVPDAYRDRAYAVMALCPQHTFLVLTKRAERMAEYWNKNPRPPFIDRSNMICEAAEAYYGADIDFVEELLYEHVWHGVTAEDQQRANERIPHLLRVPGQRFLSIEPMLGPIQLDQHVVAGDELHCDYCGGFTGDDGHDCYEPELGIHAVLLGGESGKAARPMHPDWVRSVRDQCEQAGVPFYFKQWGEWAPESVYTDRSGPSLPWLRHNGTVWTDEPITGDEDDWIVRVGKKRAGRTLDGRTHDELPWDQKGDSK